MNNEAPSAKLVFTVIFGRDGLETEIKADDFEVVAEGVHFVRDKGLDTEHVSAFVSHPCAVAIKGEFGEVAK